MLNPDGSVKQRWYYDENGRAKEGIDFNHSDDGIHKFPHRHERNWDSKSPRKSSKYEVLIMRNTVHDSEILAY